LIPSGVRRNLFVSGELLVDLILGSCYVAESSSDREMKLLLQARNIAIGFLGDERVAYTNVGVIVRVFHV
jgi:hypothetical protein